MKRRVFKRDSAKKESIQSYAKKVNVEFAKGVLKKIYGLENGKEIGIEGGE